MTTRAPGPARAVDDQPALLRLPHRTGTQLHPAVAVGAVPVAGGRGRLPSVHVAAAVATQRAAADGVPAFDLSAFDPAYFDRLREHATAAAEAGIYVSVMCFEGSA